MDDPRAHDAHFEHYRQDYARQLDERYRSWRQQPRRADNVPWRQPDLGSDHKDSPLEGLGRALSAPIMGAGNEPALGPQPVAGRIA